MGRSFGVNNGPIRQISTISVNTQKPRKPVLLRISWRTKLRNAPVPCSSGAGAWAGCIVPVSTIWVTVSPPCW